MRLGDRHFLNLFAQVASRANHDRDCDEWRVAGVDWQRRRLVNWSADVSFQIESHRLHHASRNAWTLLYVHELWWGESRDKTIRNIQWVRLHRGARGDVLKWFKERESQLDS